MKLAIIASLIHFSTALSLSTVLATSTHTPLAPQSTNPGFSDVTYSGLYKIVNCRAHVPARLRPEAVQLREFMGSIWNSARLLIADISRGTSSKYGFGPLFKINDSVRPMIFTIRSIINGGGNPTPTFLCLDDDPKNPVLQSVYQETCTAGVFATIVPNSSYIGLCPGFFRAIKRNLDFPIHPDCPTVDTTADVLREGAHPLMHNMYSIFLSQILKLHMQLNVHAARNQVYHIQDCIKLNASASLINVANWAIYAAAVHAQCTEWPTVPVTIAVEDDENEPTS